MMTINRTDASLSRSNLTNADLTNADLTNADLTNADLAGADLTRSDLTRSDMTGADMTGVNLRDADLRGANLDMSCWPLWCGTLRLKAVDARLARQVAFHFCALPCDDTEFIAARNSILEFENKFHRKEIPRLGRWEIPKEKDPCPHHDPEVEGI